MGIKAVLNNSRRNLSKAYAVLNGQRRKVVKVYAVQNGQRKLVWNESLPWHEYVSLYVKSGFNRSYDTAAFIGNGRPWNEYTIYTSNPSTRASVTLQITSLSSGEHTLTGKVQYVIFPENPPSNTDIKIGLGGTTGPTLNKISNGEDKEFSITASAVNLMLFFKMEIPIGRYNSEGGWYDYTYVTFADLKIDGHPLDLIRCETDSEYEP